jgi:hypothetical protein
LPTPTMMIERGSVDASTMASIVSCRTNQTKRCALIQKKRERERELEQRLKD